MFNRCGLKFKYAVASSESVFSVIDYVRVRCRNSSRGEIRECVHDGMKILVGEQGIKKEAFADLTKGHEGDVARIIGNMTDMLTAGGMRDEGPGRLIVDRFEHHTNAERVIQTLSVTAETLVELQI
jgi:hypothetical protein